MHIFSWNIHPTVLLDNRHLPGLGFLGAPLGVFDGVSVEGPSGLCFCFADIGDAVGAELIVEEPGSDNVVFVLNFLEVRVRTELDFAPELVHEVLIVTDDVQEDDLFLVHLLDSIFELLL